MSKRCSEDETEKWKKKLKKYTRKLDRAQAQEDHILNEDNFVVENEEIIIVSQDAEVNAVNNEDHFNGSLLSESDDSDSTEATAAAIASTAIDPTTGLEPSTSTEPSTSIDPSLLEALGDCHTDTPEWGEDILEDIAKRWEPLCIAGLKKELKEELYKRYLFPKNLPAAKPPLLNPEIAAVLTDASKNRDIRVCNKQGQLGRALAALGQAMTGLINNNVETSQTIKLLNDVGRLISDSHFLETDTRRSLITPLLDKSYTTPFKDRKRDSHLFGEKLGEFVKSSRGIKKTGQMITPTNSGTSTALNYRAPVRQQSRNSRGRANRGGGAYRAQGPAPRRPPPPPAPPAPTQAQRYASSAPPPNNNRRAPTYQSTSSRPLNR